MLSGGCCRYVPVLELDERHWALRSHLEIVRVGLRVPRWCCMGEGSGMRWEISRLAVTTRVHIVLGIGMLRSY